MCLQINVLATDDANNQLIGYSIVNIFLSDINDNAPMWNVATIEGSVPEDSAIGPLFLQYFIRTFVTLNNIFSRPR